MDVTLLKKTEKLARELAQNSSTLEDLKQVMRSLMKTTIERMLNTEMDTHLGPRTSSSSSIHCRPLEERLVVHPPLLHSTVTAIRPASQRPEQSHMQQDQWRPLESRDSSRQVKLWLVRP